ncbi:fatty acid desaturase [Trinickia caryophylli]|uniref:Omega-6 fatty acid desaturase (Delta-12 desaturase) n=1 Tax=Trinickia caryophylli TaxID=28094 RepID=A0A1X7GEG9_TRICW|nr:fatty acid desaturase [Trinickia caryophylli]WQE15437.1 fatty acid desaturase [Trinickia caryophylli]SMF68361.1 omega-6 fatty acid desaturase (delta-12 desaturase) [Trinickia caryophylli]
MTMPSRPVPPDAPLPHRKTLRSWLEPWSGRTTLRPILLLILDYALFAALLAVIVLVHSLVVKLAAALAAGFVIGRLFIIGHDACHQSLTPHRTLNRWLGRIAFLPSLTPYSLWEVGHNVVHHGYTNLKGFDFIWAPLTREEFDALPRSRQWLERLYRCGWAPGLYYMIEIWWRRMFFPTKAAMPTRRPVFFRDCWLVAVFWACWLAALVWGAQATGQSVSLLLLAGFVIPFLFWCSMIGFVVYVHHTHERVRWYDDRAAWANAQPFVSTTVHLTFRWRFGALMHHIMEHTAHHLDMSIPLYQLKDAQAKLEELLPQRIVIQPFSWRWYFTTARHCKLYDFRASRWTGFDGRASA